jgi:hypothetical protein
VDEDIKKGAFNQSELLVADLKATGAVKFHPVEAGGHGQYFGAGGGCGLSALRDRFPGGLGFLSNVLIHS